MQNATTQYLSLLTPSQYNYLLKSVSNSLPHTQRVFTQEWVHDTIVSWCRNDSFKSFLASKPCGVATTLPLLAKHLKGRSSTIRDRMGKDALLRKEGFKTKDERSMGEEKQLQRVTATSPNTIHSQVDDDYLPNDGTEAVFDVYCTYFNDKADIDLEIRELISYVYKECRGTYKKYIPQYATLYFQGMTKEEISKEMGVSKDTVRNICRMFQSIAREGRERGLV